MFSITHLDSMRVATMIQCIMIVTILAYDIQPCVVKNVTRECRLSRKSYIGGYIFDRDSSNFPYLRYVIM